MSEAELHMLNARLIGGQLNKARRGELPMPTPLGYVVGPDGKLMLDPDEQIQSIVRLLFDTFQRSGSAGAVVRYFREQALAWPQRVVTGPRAGTFVTGTLARSRVLGMLHNPRYAGAYVYGRTRQRKLRRVRLFFVGGPISLSGGGEAGGNWIRQGVVRSGGGSGGRRYFCRQRPMGDFRWSSRAS